MSLAFEHPEYHYGVVRRFALMTVVWGLVGMAAILWDFGAEPTYT